MSLIIAGLYIVAGLVPVLGSVASAILGVAFTLSLSMVFLKIVKGEEIAVGNVFYGFEDLWTAIKAQFFMGLF